MKRNETNTQHNRITLIDLINVTKTQNNRRTNETIENQQNNKMKQNEITN